MAYRPPQRIEFSTTYTPKYMAGDFKSKKIAAPEQPAGLTISSYKISEYVNKMVLTNNLKGYKQLFEQIKILVKSVMHVLCEKKFTIDFPLWNRVNSITIPQGIKDTTITFPVQKYEYERWVLIFRALIPSVPYPFNADSIDNPLSNSTSIELISGSSSIASGLSDYSSDISEDSPLQECHEEWYETAVYAYQNLLLTSSSKKREIIDTEFQEATSKARNRNDRNAAHDARSKAINNLKKNTYDWVNRIGHIVKSFHYIRLKASPERISHEFMRYAELMLMNGVLNNTFMYSGLIDPEYAYLTDIRKAYPREAYMSAVRFYRNKECVSDNKRKERMLYDTIAKIIILYRNYHYGQRDNGLLHEFNIQSAILDYFNESVSEQQHQIRILINQLTNNNYNDILMELKTFNESIVKRMLADNVHGESQQMYTIKMMTEFNIREEVIAEMRIHNLKSYESYHNTVAWCILYNVVPFSVMTDEQIVTPKCELDIYIALLAGAKINPQLIKNNMDTIKEITDKLKETARGYAKFRLSDALIEANNAIINL